MHPDITKWGLKVESVFVPWCLIPAIVGNSGSRIAQLEFDSKALILPNDSTHEQMNALRKDSIKSREELKLRAEIYFYDKWFNWTKFVYNNGWHNEIDRCKKSCVEFWLVARPIVVLKAKLMFMSLVEEILPGYFTKWLVNELFHGRFHVGG